MASGDNEKQAALRDKATTNPGGSKPDPYFEEILRRLNPESRVLDIGCGTGHILARIVQSQPAAQTVGLDASGPMLKRAAAKAKVAIARGDALHLPFSSESFDLALSRLADFDASEVSRVLRPGGVFLEYGLGPDSDREFREFFPDRVDLENFFVQRNEASWKTEIAARLDGSGLAVSAIKDFHETTRLASVDDLLDYIEMIPLLLNFDRSRDRSAVEAFAKRYGDGNSAAVTWNYYVLISTKVQ
jgi:SAM-dependent methyltransferase